MIYTENSLANREKARNQGQKATERKRFTADPTSSYESKVVEGSLLKQNAHRINKSDRASSEKAQVDPARSRTIVEAEAKAKTSGCYGEHKKLADFERVR